MIYSVVIVKDGGTVDAPKMSRDIDKLKRWIHKQYPTAYHLPVLLNEYYGYSYVCKYSNKFRGVDCDPVTIYIKKIF